MKSQQFYISFSVHLTSCFLVDDEVDKRVQEIVKKSRSVIALGKKFMYEQMEMNISEAYRFVNLRITQYTSNLPVTLRLPKPFPQ